MRRIQPLLVRGCRLPPWRGWVVSSAIHLAVLLLLGLWTVAASRPSMSEKLETAWTVAETPAESVDLSTVVAEDLDINPDAGGAGTDFLATAEMDSSVAALSVSDHFADSPMAAAAAVAPAQRRSARRRNSALAKSTGSGTGAGSGIGPGSGPGFFGLEPPEGRQIVFVVDSSRSMNHPHDSEAKTRFRRLKIELVKCILEMQAEQSFYVVFFSNEVSAMPSRGPQPSIPGVRDPYLRWIAEMNALGAPTDPMPALDLALRLRPDVICFLTDGEFDKGIQRRLRRIQQTETAIHTFAFGEASAEEVLRAVAENNAGEYRFIP